MKLISLSKVERILDREPIYHDVLNDKFDTLEKIRDFVLLTQVTIMKLANGNLLMTLTFQKAIYVSRFSVITIRLKLE